MGQVIMSPHTSKNSNSKAKISSLAHDSVSRSVSHHDSFTKINIELLTDMNGIMRIRFGYIDLIIPTHHNIHQLAQVQPLQELHSSFSGV